MFIVVYVLESEDDHSFDDAITSYAGPFETREEAEAMKETMVGSQPDNEGSGEPLFNERIYVEELIPGKKWKNPLA